MYKTTLVAVTATLLALASLPVQAGLNASFSDGAGMQGATAVAAGTVTFDAALSVGGGEFNLTAQDAGALFFLPEMSSIGGQSFSALCSLGTCSASSDNPGLSVILPQPVDFAAGASVSVVLAFRGDVVGVHAVDYSLVAFDGGLSQQYDANGRFNVTVSPVPEPAAYALLLGGLAAVAARVRRRAV